MPEKQLHPFIAAGIQKLFLIISIEEEGKHAIVHSDYARATDAETAQRITEEAWATQGYAPKKIQVSEVPEVAYLRQEEE